MAISIVASGCAPEAEESAPAEVAKETLVITELNWDSPRYQAYIFGFIIEHGYGYPIEYVSGSSISMFEGVMAGEIDIYPEIWLPNQQQVWDQAMEESGFIPFIPVTITNDDNWQSLFTVPTFVIEGDPSRGIEPLAPDLKSVQDLKRPEIIELFEDPEDPGKGRIYTCIPGWECEKIHLKQIDALGLDEYYNAFPPGSEAGLWASLKAAHDKGEPWLGVVWAPTWIAGMLDLTVLEETPYSPELFEQGLCAWPSADLWIVTSNEFGEKAPELFPFLLKIRMTTEELNLGLAYMLENDAESDEAALWFLKNRQEVWLKWVPDEVAAKVQAKLAELEAE
ncbi:MAG: ABC transporter substrate-binding protein [Dehalococcoidia bacterium]|nr:MAG: ABC transporter substrate-binding protein [Dehalococcoidia bacterium]